MLKFSALLGLIFMINSCNLPVNNRNQVYIPYVISGSPDPFNILYSGDWITTTHLWSPLIDLKADGTFEPLLAKSWKRSLDGLEWTFELKDNLKWSDGSVMKIEQIIESLRISKNGTSHTDLSKAIVEIKAKGDSTLYFKLNLYIPQFLHGLAYVDWSIVHPENIERTDEKAEVINYDKFSGPYKLAEPFQTKSVVKSIKLLSNDYFPRDINKKI